MPAQVNALLVAVNAADTASGGVDDWDTPAAAATGATPATGAVKWANDDLETRNAYYNIGRVRTAAGDTLETRSLIIDTAVARASGLDTDDVITFLDPAGATRTARAKIVQIRELDGIPDDLQTTRLELDEQ